MGNAIGKERCPRCAENGNDKSGDNLVIYDDGGKVCFRPGCGYTILSDDYKAKYGGYELVGKPFDESVAAQIRNYTVDPNGFRGLTRDTCAKFRVRHVFNDRNEVVEQYYPATINYELSGYKVRKNPKDFDAYGTTGKACDMFGQVIFRNSNSKTVIITGGELDAMSAYQMLHDYQKAKGNGEFEPVPVVSCTVGEGGTAKQIQAHYEWFSRFDKIILCLDNDEAGKRAAEECMMVLPKGKAYRLDMTLKDPNKYLEEGRGREFVAAYWAAKPIIPAGVIGSDDLYDRVIENVSTECIPLPDFMEELAEMMGGEIPLGYIVNFASASGAGKTTVVNEMIYHWIFNCPVPIGVVSMELDAGQYGETMLSRHLGRKISLIPGKQAKLEYLQSEYVRTKARELFRKEDGSPRWHLVDDRDGGLETIQATVEQLIISCGCRVIILDPLQDLLDGLSNEEQAVFMRWQKRMVKSHKVTFINISHVRKNSTGQQANSTGAFLSEEDMSGSSTIFKSGGANVLFGRNKYAEDPVERNTITAVMSKCRWTGLTGPAGQWYYDNIKHTMMSKRKWVEDNNHIPSEEAFAEAENMANKLLSAASALSVGDVEFET